MANEFNEAIGKEVTDNVESNADNVQKEVEPPTLQKAEPDQVLASLREIKDIIQDRLEYDAVKEKAFDKLYEEMKRLKEQTDILDRNIRPLLSDLLLLYDSMKKHEALLSQKVQNSDDNMSDFKDLVSELIEILYRQEVVPMEDDLSGRFNSKIQKAIKTENSDTEEDDLKITAIARAGFFWRDKVLRPQEVIIKRFSNKQ